MKRQSILAIALLGLLAFRSNSPEQAFKRVVEISTLKAHQLSEHLERQGFDVASHGHNGILEVVTLDIEKLNSELAVFAEAEDSGVEILSVIASVPYRVYAENTENTAYWDYDESLAAMRKLVTDYPDQASLINITQKFKLDQTIDGNDLYALQVSDNPSVLEDEPKIMFIGQHHARELMTHHAVIDTAEYYLQEAASGNEDMRLSLEQNAVWFMPVVNPDGLDYIFDRDRSWRKNRKRNADGTYGVDLNRNYEFKWGECGSNSSNPSSGIYKGTAPFSEVETLTMDRLVDYVRPDYIISYHSSGDEVLFPYKCGDLAEESVIMGLRDRLTAELSFGRRVASSSGEDFEHHYAMYGALSYLLEIGSSFQPDFSVYTNRVFPNVKKALPLLIGEIKRQPTLYLKTIDASDSSPVSAEISLDEIKFKEGEVRRTDAFGSYRWRLDPGAYTVTVKAPGYQTQSVSVNLSAARQLEEIVLQKL